MLGGEKSPYFWFNIHMAGWKITICFHRSDSHLHSLCFFPASHSLVNSGEKTHLEGPQQKIPFGSLMERVVFFGHWDSESFPVSGLRGQPKTPHNQKLGVNFWKSGNVMFSKNSSIILDLFKVIFNFLPW